MKSLVNLSGRTVSTSRAHIRSRRLVLAASGVAVTLLASSLSHAASVTWVGNTDPNLATAGNWSALPVANDLLIFDAASSAGATLNNDLAAITLSGITFNAAAPSYVINPAAVATNTIDFASGAIVTNNSLNLQTINTEAVASAPFSVAGVGDIALQRVRMANPNGNNVLTMNGTGTLTLGNASASTHNNNLALVVNSGTVNLGMAGTNIAVDRGLTINGGTVRYTGTSSNMVTDGQAVTLAAGATLDLNGIGDTIGALNGAGGTVTSGSFVTLAVGGSNAGGSYAGTITGALAINKIGSGTETLSGVNTYTGGTTFTGGMLNIGNASAVSTGGLTIAGGGFDNTTGSALTLSQNVVWSGSGTFGGSNNLTLSGSQMITTGSGTAVNLQLNGTGGKTLTISGPINTNVDADRNLNVNPQNVDNSFVFSNSSLVLGDIVIGALASSTHTFTIGGGGNTNVAQIIVNGVISDGAVSNNLSLVNSGTITLNGANTFTGTTSIGSTGALHSASVVIGNKNALGSDAGNIIFNTAKLSANTPLTGTNAIARNLVIQGGIAANPATGGTSEIGGTNPIAFGGTITNAAGDRALLVSNTGGTTFGGTLNLSNDANTRTLTVIANGPTTFSGLIQSNALLPADAGNMTIAGTNTVTISGNNTATGRLLLLGGTLVLDYSTQNNAKLPVGGGPIYTSGTTTSNNTSSLTIQGGQNIVLSGGSYTEPVLGFTLNAGSALNVSRTSGTSSLALGTFVRGGTGRTLNIQSGTASTSVTNGAAGILGGWWTASGTDFAINTTNAANGPIGAYTAYQTGTESTWAATDNVSITADPALGASRTINTLKTTSGFAVPSGMTLTLNDGGLLNTGAGNRTISGGTIKAGQATTSELIVHQHGTGTLTIGSVIANGNGASQLTKAGDGTLILAGNNTYTGITNITKGTLKLGVNNAINPGTSQDVQVSGGAKFDLNGFNQTVRNVNLVSNTLGTAEVTNSSATPSTLTMNMTANNTGNSNILFSGNLALVVRAPGAQYQMSNPFNSYTGGTTISGTAGVTLLTSQLAATGGVTVTGTATTDLRINSETSLGSGTLTLDNGRVWAPSNTNYIVANNIAVTSNGGVLMQDSSSSAYTGSISTVSGSPILAFTAGATTRQMLQLAGSMSAFTGTFAVDTANVQVSLSGNAKGSSNADVVFFGPGTSDRGVIRWNGGASATTVSFGEISNLAGHTATTGIFRSSVAAPVTFQIGRNTANTATFGGIFENGSGTVSLTKVGTNTQVLTGANTYTGATTINGGALRVNGSLSTSSSVAVNATANSAGALQGTGTVGTVTLGANNGTNIARISPGAGAGSVGVLNMTGLAVSGGDLQLDMLSPGSNDIVNVTGTGAGALTFAGASTISVSPAAVGTYTLLQSGSNIVYTVAPTLVPQVRATMTVDTTTDPKKYVVNVSSIGSVALNWTGAVDGAWDIQNKTNWQSPSLANDVFFSGDAVSFGNGPTNRNVSIIAGGVLPQSVTINNTAGNDYTIGGGAIGGLGSLVKSGSGSVTLSNANTYAGGTALNAGAIKIGNANALGTGALTTASGSTLDLNGIALAIGGAFSGSGTIINTAATAGSITVAGGTYAGAIQDGAGTVGITNTANTLTLTGNNTFNGAVTASGGTVVAGSATALGGNGSAIVVNGGTIDLNGFSRTSGSLGGAGGTVTNSAGTPVTLTLNQSSASTFGGTLSGAVSLVKNGSGSITLSGANAYTGDTTLSGGTVVLPNGQISAFGPTGTVTLASNSATTPILTVMPGSGSTPTATNSVYISNNLVVQAGTINVIDNSVNGFGNLWLGGTMTGSGTLVFQNTNGSSSQFAATSATLFLGNHLAGFNGTVRLESPNAVGRSYAFIAMEDLEGGITTWDASHSAWVLGSDPSAGAGIIQWNNAELAPVTVKLGSLAGAATTSRVVSSNAASTTFEIGALNTSTSYAGVIVDGNAVNFGTASVNKVGSGTLTLTGANTYTGRTTVTSGKLVLGRAGGADQPVLGGANVASPGGVDIVNGTLVIDYTGSTSPSAIVSPLMSAGFAANFTTGQIMSSGTIDASHTLGWYDNASNLLTIALTRPGDANCDRTVNFSDLLALAANYNTVGTAVWGKGDFNYDGNVNFSDLLALAANYNQTVAGSFAADWALAQSAVPEPTTLGAIGAVAAMGLRRQRR
ncbi:MAG: autotransporter-associated beta strand repeat-containing protein [Tepidisphaeraceae bacterium]